MMRSLNCLYTALLAAATFLEPTSALRSAPKVKLSNVQSLTLRKGLETSHRRVSAIPQLKCIGGSGRSLYEVDVMRCKNSGSDYDDDSIQWTCTASLPEEFKLGSTDVICEGYDYPEDPYILKGSCGVEYRLVLTEKGEEKYGRKKPWFGGGGDDAGGHEKMTGDKVVAAVFWVIFIGVAAWIVYNAARNWTTGQGGAGAGVGGNRPGWGGGGGGGWGGYGGNDDPPPPYDWRPGQNYKQSYGSTNQQGWRPGFWSGALGGAAAGYAAGRSGRNNNQSMGSGWGSSRWNNGEGSSRSSSGSSGSPSYSSTRHESTGFGSTSRR